MKKKLLTCMAAAAAVQLAGAAPILWDLSSSDPANIDSVAADFTAAGVAEDITGASVLNVEGTTASGSTMTATNGVTLTLTDNKAQGLAVNSATMTGAGSSILKEYIYLRSGSNKSPGPIVMQIGGLGSQLDADTDYALYLWGIGDNAEEGALQNASFTFNGETQVVSSVDPDDQDASNYMAKFTFNTGSTVSETLDFTWARDGDNLYAGFNGFAIVAVPEPATLGMVAAFGGAVLFIRRRFMI